MLEFVIIINFKQGAMWSISTPLQSHLVSHSSGVPFNFRIVI